MDTRIIKELLDRYTQETQARPNKTGRSMARMKTEFPDNGWSKWMTESRLVWMNDLHEELSKTIQNSNLSPSDDKTFVPFPGTEKCISTWLQQ